MFAYVWKSKRYSREREREREREGGGGGKREVQANVSGASSLLLGDPSIVVHLTNQRSCPRFRLCTCEVEVVG